MINLSLVDEEVHRCPDSRSAADQTLRDTTKDIVNDDALWADFQTRCRQSKEGHTNFNTQQILAEFMEQRSRQRQVKAAARQHRKSETSSFDGDLSDDRSCVSIDSFRSAPEDDTNTLFQVAANTTRRFRRTTMNMLTNTFEDAPVSSSSSSPLRISQPPQTRATMSMVSGYVMSKSTSNAENTTNSSSSWNSTSGNTNTSNKKRWARSSSVGHGAPSHSLPERSIYDMAREAAPIPPNTSPMATNIEFPNPPSARAILYNRQSSLTFEEATGATSLSILPLNQSTGAVGVGSKNSSMTSVVGKFVERARSSLVDEEVDMKKS